MTEFNVKVTRQAFDQLGLIIDHLNYRLENQEAAREMLALFKSTITGLAVLPKRYPCIEEHHLGEFGLRRTQVSSYYVYYFVDDETQTVQVVAIIHSRMDQKAQLQKMDDIL